LIGLKIQIKNRKDAEVEKVREKNDNRGARGERRGRKKYDLFSAPPAVSAVYPLLFSAKIGQNSTSKLLFRHRNF
jgi:hypothetical protein